MGDLPSRTATPADPPIVRSDLTALEALELARREHPGLGVARGRWIEDGWDNRVLEATLESGERVIFRFPRDASFPSELELAVLRALRGKTSVAIPDPTYLGRDYRYVGYRRLDGVHLDDERYACFELAKRERLGEGIAKFLLSVHRALDARELAPLGLRRATFAERLESELPILTGLPMPGLAAFARAALADYCELERAQTEHAFVLFNDLHHENMLLDAADGLSGVIDFGDVAFGDVHWEFRYFFWFNPDLLERAVAAYRRLASIPLRLGRIRLFAIVQNLCEVAHSYRDPTSKVPRARAEARLSRWIEDGPRLWRDAL